MVQTLWQASVPTVIISQCRSFLDRRSQNNPTTFLKSIFAGQRVSINFDLESTSDVMWYSSVTVNNKLSGEGAAPRKHPSLYAASDMVLKKYFTENPQITPQILDIFKKHKGSSFNLLQKLEVQKILEFTSKSDQISSKTKNTCSCFLVLEDGQRYLLSSNSESVGELARDKCSYEAIHKLSLLSINK
ncbi:hypothetical protein P9112_005947 [Eukaryota sp. TZLM1-RC]